MNRAVMVPGVGALGIGIFALYNLRERQRRNDYLAARSCVADLRTLLASCVLSEEEGCFEVETENHDLIVIGNRFVNGNRPGWFEYSISVLLESGVKAGTLHGSRIFLSDAEGNYLGEMSLVADETWTLHASIALPDSEAYFSLKRGLAYGTLVFSHQE